MDITAVKTEPYQDQKFGTSGLRRRVSVFMQKNYLQNVVQSLFDSLSNFEGKTLVVGGDGRFFNDKAIQIIIKIAIANGFGHIVVGKNGWLSTPALSHLITLKNAFGGIILTASHNPGGKDGDFGIKFDTANGAPAPISLTNAITEHTKIIDHFWWVDEPDIDLRNTGTKQIGNSVVEVVDPVADYAAYMQQIFDFKVIRNLFSSGFRFTFDAMNAITGPYAIEIFEHLLGAGEGSVVHAEPLPDFGGLHPDPNLVYAKHLVDRMNEDGAPDFAAASDGDGDRYMILGPKFFVNPSDSLAILADYLDKLPFYHDTFYGVARSMPTSSAVDMVAERKKLPLYKTPTGWKFFGSLLENKKISLCGEESFGAGSYHAMEKDGIWAVLAWLNILAITQKMPQQLVQELWEKDGRVYYCRHNYEDVPSEKAQHLMDSLKSQLPTLPGSKFGLLTIKSAEIFSYTDPITNEYVSDQGVFIQLSHDASFMVRLSGTGTVGATLRLYFSKREKNWDSQPAEVLAPVILAATSILQTPKYLEIDAPTTIT
ncbi:MAG: alpha-D-glucose phosphate-specific phosphoglucomutase [Alphaproteobacteria bacterium]|nr:alpha-D-glucose phosphate-specific phosphoglucomutase [Alphaproteobacteria bacterium]